MTPTHQVQKKISVDDADRHHQPSKKKKDSQFKYVGLAESLADLAEAKKSDIGTWEHLSIVAIQLWADGSLPSTFLDDQLAGPWREHYETCSGCQSVVAQYRQQITARG